MKGKDLRSKFECYIVDENDWDATYEVLSKGNFIGCVQSTKDELERMIEDFQEEKEDFQEDLDKIEAFLLNPKEELGKVKKGYKPLYVRTPLGYTISIE
jgi:hypothetical protein